jgi:transposase-like protein
LAEDTLAFTANQTFHLNCRRTRDLSAEERALFFTYCRDHAVAKCVACAASFRQQELGSDLLANQSYLCPRCRADLTISIRTHLFTCTIVPPEVRERAQAVRDAARALVVKQSAGLRDLADVLRVEAEVAMARLRETMTRVTAAALRRQTDRAGGSGSK